MKSDVVSLIQDSVKISNNPLVKLFQHQIEVSKTEKRVVSSEMLPDITFGYFNQSFIGSGVNSNGTSTVFDAGDRFKGVQLGVTIPLWFKSHSAKVAAAKINITESEARLKNVSNLAETKFKLLKNELQNHQSNIDLYEQNAMPQAELLLNHSLRGFQEGQIGYIEYVQGLNRAFSIKTNYLEFINQYNQTIIEFEHLISKN